MQRILVVVVLAALALAACSKQPAEITANDQVPADQATSSASEGGASASEGAGGGDATWVAVDIAFEAAPSTLPAGENTITLTNNGSATHNVTIDGEVIVEAAGGATEEGTVALEPGTHEYICSVPGHEQLMSGEITVE